MINNMRALLFCICIVPLFFAFESNAQLNVSELAGARTSLVTDPAFPRPGEEVEVSFEGNRSQLYGASITWRVDGEVVADATNQRTMTFRAGELGIISEVTAVVQSGSRTPQNYALQVGSVYTDIVLEPQTRVPNFYQGRAVPSAGAQINATALVNNGTIVDPSTHAYTWIVNGQVLNGGPIKGLNQISFETPRGSETIIQLSVFNEFGNLIANRNIYFLTERPELVFYETNTLYGLSPIGITRTLETTNLNNSLVAEPYYLDIRTYNNPDILEWEIDGIETAATNNPYQMTISAADTTRSEVSFHVRSTTNLLQGIEDDIRIIVNE